MGIVTHLTTTVASIGVVCHYCLHRSIVGHTQTWCLGVSLLLRALITKLLLVVGTLLVLVLVARRVLALIPLTRGPLVPGRKADMTMPASKMSQAPSPASKMSQAPSQATTTQVLPTPTPAQVIDGPVTRSSAKKLQQEVHALLCEIKFNVNENYILPKCSTLIVLRYIEEEKD